MTGKCLYCGLAARSNLADGMCTQCRLRAVADMRFRQSLRGVRAEATLRSVEGVGGADFFAELDKALRLRPGTTRGAALTIATQRSCGGKA